MQDHARLWCGLSFLVWKWPSSHYALPEPLLGVPVERKRSLPRRAVVFMVVKTFLNLKKSLNLND